MWQQRLTLPVLQGNGHERDFMDDHRVYILDAYNRYIYPGDGFAKREWDCSSHSKMHRACCVVKCLPHLIISLAATLTR